MDISDAQVVTYLGHTTFRRRHTLFGIKQADRRQHLYLVGKTGSGKSTLLKNLIIQDIQADRGVAVLDPHGDLARDLLRYIPPHRADDLVYFAPADTERPIGFNLLGNVPKDARPLVAASIVSAFRNIWADSWGPRMEYILYNTLVALLDYQDSSLLGVTRMLVDEPFRARVVRRIDDPMVRFFWRVEFENYEPRFVREAIAPIQNKVGQFLTSAPIRNIVGQVRSTIDLKFMMDNRRIFIANLSKGEIGEENAHLLGSLLTTQFQVAAMRRAPTPEAERVDFHLYADEFHNFTTDSFASILSEARKYRLCLVLAHQYIDQLTPAIRSAVFGNVGTVIAFRVGFADAQVLEDEFAPTFSANDLIGLEQFHIVLKLAIDGATSRPFSAVTFPPHWRVYGREVPLLRHTREKYGRRRAVVEEKIERWVGNVTSGDQPNSV